MLCHAQFRKPACDKRIQQKLEQFCKNENKFVLEHQNVCFCLFEIVKWINDLYLYSGTYFEDFDAFFSFKNNPQTAGWQWKAALTFAKKNHNTITA